MDTDSLDEFVKAYLVCALWSSVDDDGNPLDAGRDLDDCSDEFIVKAQKDCQSFRDLCIEKMGEDAFEEWEDEQAGHDFWLTRNRHGVGFWDRGKENGDELTKWAKSFGECYLYIGDDGKIYSD